MKSAHADFLTCRRGEDDVDIGVKEGIVVSIIMGKRYFKHVIERHKCGVLRVLDAEASGLCVTLRGGASCVACGQETAGNDTYQRIFDYQHFFVLLLAKTGHSVDGKPYYQNKAPDATVFASFCARLRRRTKTA